MFDEAFMNLKSGLEGKEGLNFGECMAAM